MKLSTIWTLRGMSLAERFRRTYDLAMVTAAVHLPRRIAYWSYIHQGVRAFEDDEVVTEVRYMDVLQRLAGGPR